MLASNTSAQLVPFAFMAPPAGGSCSTLVGGYCWHKTTSAAESCTTRCSSLGGVHPATRYYAGSYGTTANCQSVLIALGETAPSVTYDLDSSAGCYRAQTTARAIGSLFTDYSVGVLGSQARRACACNDNSDPQPALNEVTGLTNLASNSSSAYLEWNHTGGGNAGYRIAYQTGSTAPADCTSATILESSITSALSSSKLRHYVDGLSPSTTYSFRVCASNDNSPLSLTAGQTVTLTTSASDPLLIAKRPTVGPTLQYTASSGTIVSTPFTTTGTNRFLMVTISQWSTNANDVTSITYAGDALTKLTSLRGSSVTHDLWVLVNPSLGFNTLSINKTTAISSSGRFQVGVVQYNGVHQTTPYTELVENTYSSVSGFQSDIISSTQDKLLVLASSVYPGGFTASDNLNLDLSGSVTLAEVDIHSVGGDSSVLIESTVSSIWGGFTILELNPIP